jgi:hypothetical protein
MQLKTQVFADVYGYKLFSLLWCRELPTEVHPGILDTLCIVHAQCEIPNQGGNKEHFHTFCVETEVMFRLWRWSHHGRRKHFFSVDACIYMNNSAQ